MASTVKEEHIMKLRAAGYLAADIAHRLPDAGQIIPTPGPHERVVFLAHCHCQNRRISGRGSRSVRLRLMVTGTKGHNVYPGSGPLDGGKTLRPA